MSQKVYTSSLVAQQEDSKTKMAGAASHLGLTKICA
jgi:hypothetical protein